MAERTALVVPEHAVFQLQDRAYVYRVGDDLIAREQQIQTGDRRFGLVEVLGGLEEGDLIVTEGIVKLRDGAQVRIEDQGAELSGLHGPAVTTGAPTGG
jgi:membrane fusion protein (multidrug efflux system)